MKRMLLILVVIISLAACSQVKNEIAQHKNINVNNIVEESTKHIKHYPSEK